MKYNIGDKVSFLNEKRDGIVKRIISKDIIGVEIEDGFEIPVAAKDLIIIGKNNETQATTYTEKTEKQRVDTPVSDEDEEEADGDSLVQPLFEDLADKKESLMLAFQPINELEILKDGFFMWFVNKTPYDVLFTCYKKEEGVFKGYVYDAVPAQSKYLVATIGKEEINDWSSQMYQCLFFSDGKQELKQPLHKEMNIAMVKFFKDSTFIHTKMLDARAYVLSFYEEVIPDVWKEEDYIKEALNPISVRNIKEMFSGNIKVEVLPKKHIVAPFIAEVDLHIHELTDNDKDLSNHEMLNIQLAYFAKCLDAAIVHKFKKVTFIHGVGQGRLKEEIHKIITESYAGVKIQDAPFKKYGQGATEVLIPFNLTR